MKRRVLLAALTSAGLCGVTGAFAQVASQNPMGLDYGPMHPPVPAQVTTYYPPAPVSVPNRRHHRARGPSY